MNHRATESTEESKGKTRDSVQFSVFSVTM